MSRESEQHVLVADIGGTHGRFALFRLAPASAGSGAPLALSLTRRVVFRTREQRTTTELLSRLYKDGEEAALLGTGAPSPAAAVLAIPAPTKGKDPLAEPDRDECCPCPNISWPICWSEAAAVLGLANIHLVNDFVAQGYACGALPEALDPAPVFPGDAVPGAPIALMGAGTGFGQCLIRPGKMPAVDPSEGGHSLFPFVGGEEYRYADFLHEHTPGVPLIKDLVLSGQGLALLYTFHTGKKAPVEDVPGLLAEDEDGHARVLEWYARFYARACREYVLYTLPLGGIYITGGMATRVPGLFSHPAFAAEFKNSPAMRAILEKIPVFHVRNQAAGLWGAAVFAAFALHGPRDLAIA